MVNRPRRTIAQGVVAICVAGLLAAGVWIAAGHDGETAGGDDDAEASFPVSALVPDGVEFILSTSWPKLQDSALMHAIVAERPDTVSVRRILGALLHACGPLRLASNPDLKLLPAFESFSFEDVLAGEVIVAGRLRGRAEPARTYPLFDDFLLLTRISPELADALSTLTVEEAKQWLDPEIMITEVEGGILQLAPSSQLRAYLGSWQPGLVAQRDPSWYVLRVDDVVAIGNNVHMLRATAAIAASITESGGWPASFELASRTPPGGLTVYADLHPLRRHVVELLERAEVPASLLRHWIVPSTLDALELRVDGSDPGGVHAEAELHYEPGRLTPEFRDAYGLEPGSLEVAASLVPVEDTFALLTLRSPSEIVIDAVLQELFTAGDRKLWQDNFERMGSAQEVAGLFRAVQAALGETWTLALARRGAVFDYVEYQDFQARPEMPDPSRPTWAVLASLVRDADADVLSGQLSRLLAATGIPMEPVRHKGFTLYLPVPPSGYIDMSWVPTVWLVTDDHLIVASDEAYARRIVNTVLEPDASPPLTTDATWRETTSHLPDAVQLGVYVDLERLFRVPPSATPGSQPRGYLWDRRNGWVAEHSDPREAAMKHRLQLRREYRKAHGTVDADARRGIEDEVDRYLDAWSERYPEFEESYLQQLANYGRLRGLGIAITSSAGVLHADAYLGVDPGDGR